MRQTAVPARLDAAAEKYLRQWIEAIVGDNQTAINDMLNAMSENPGRITRGYASMLSGYNSDPQQILKIALNVPADGNHGLVCSLSIPFQSFCAHHFLPFVGTVDIVYEPSKYIVGIGKMPRLVACRSKRFQLQELLTKQLAEDMEQYAAARGVYVRSAAKHLCVCYRGPNYSTVSNTTSISLGTLRDPNRMAEISGLLNQGMS